MAMLGLDDPNRAKREIVSRLLAEQAQGPVGNPLGAAAQGASKIVQALIAKQLLNEQATQRAGANATLENAMRLGQDQAAETVTYPGQEGGESTTINWDARKGDPKAMVRALMGNPETQGLGINLFSQQQQREQENADWQNRFNMQDAAAQTRARESERAADERQSSALAAQREHWSAQLAQARMLASEGGEVNAKLRAAGIEPGTPEARAFILQLSGRSGDVPDEKFADPALAQRLGVPVSDVDPYRGLTTKGRDQMRNAQDRSFQKWNDEALTADAADIDLMKTLDRFIGLNTTTGTGGIIDNYGGQTIKGVLDPEYKEMTTITARLAPQMRVPGSGATSDFDAKQFERATVGVDKPKEVNRSIAEGRKLAAQNARDFRQFYRDYYAANGHTTGAEESWKQYANANPIFDPEKQGYALNPNRKTYKEWFGANRASAPTATPSPGDDPLGLRVK